MHGLCIFARGCLGEYFITLQGKEAKNSDGE